MDVLAGDSCRVFVLEGLLVGLIIVVLLGFCVCSYDYCYGELVR